MSYNSHEISVQDGNPIELYEFSRGYAYWRFTSSAYEYVDGMNVYESDAVERTDIGQTDDLNKGGIGISFPLNNYFAKEFLGAVPEKPTLVTVYRLHGSDGQKISYWKGRILSVKVEDYTIKFACESIFSSLKRVGLRARYERSCRHSLYDEQCMVSMDLLRTAGDVYAQNNMVLSLTNIHTLPSGYLNGGMVKDVDDVYRFIINHSGSTITIAKPYYRSVVGEELVVYPGCDKSMTQCNSKFNNTINFGGFPWIPSRNPFDGSIS